jgi:hypothetical protein
VDQVLVPENAICGSRDRDLEISRPRSGDL